MIWIALCSYDLVSSTSVVFILPSCFFASYAKWDTFLGLSFLYGFNDVSRSFCIEHHESIISDGPYLLSMQCPWCGTRRGKFYLPPRRE